MPRADHPQRYHLRPAILRRVRDGDGVLVNIETIGESLDHRGARTLLVFKPESPRELSSALTGGLEISTATTIRHSQPAELDLVEQGGRFSPRGPTRPLPLWTSPQLSPRPAVVASVTVVSGFRDAFPAPGRGRERDVRDESASVCLGGAGRQWY